jgi:DNA-binding MarR family transcriptional regulator
VKESELDPVARERIRVRWLDDTEAAAWRGWIRMTSLLNAEVGRTLERDSGLSLADYEVLVNLSETAEHRLRMSELASRLMWSKSRLSHQVARMADRGLVERKECPSDARGTLAELTELGLGTIVAAAPAHVARVRSLLFDRLDRAQVEALVVLTETIVEALSASCPNQTDDSTGDDISGVRASSVPPCDGPGTS